MENQREEPGRNLKSVDNSILRAEAEALALVGPKRTHTHVRKKGAYA
ncbi:uncharacterized protein G2W53_035581 [Senna tora]|uniref:Uncharacterized protein n=1 Tax=Senna tora TaxID=362788 RepID=A0A834SQT9_9FABA|nr:uncharacterized protein G2W53_035581 [Senna tora]